jgi:protein TonB
MNARLLDTALATCAAALATGGTLLLVARMNQVPDAPPRPSSTPARSIPLSSAPQPPDALENLPEPEPRLEAASVTESQALRPLTPSALPSLSGKAALAGLGALTGMALGSLGAPAVAASASAGPADRPARPLRRPAPRYPAQARRQGVEGYAVVRLRVSATGWVDEVIVVDSRPEGVFDDVARDAARRYRFEPAISNGNKVATTLEQRIVFRLKR